MLATIRDGTPTILDDQRAQHITRTGDRDGGQFSARATRVATPTPRPIMGTRVRAWLLICDRAANEIAASIKAPACTFLPPYRMHNGSKNRAEIIVTKL